MTTAGPPRIWPKPLRRGATLAVLSPASTPRPEFVNNGLLGLRQMGYQPVLTPHALAAGPLYYAGSIEQRVQDLHAAFADPKIDALLCTRGGWGSAELLPYLDADLIRANPKPFLGYSDHTSLHLWFENVTGLVTFYAPMVAPDFARDGGVDGESWLHSLEAQSPWSINSSGGLRTLKAGQAHGMLRGGCLSLYAESLGTPFAAQPLGGILFLEDVGTKPYQWDRMLLHLRYAGLLDNVDGIIFGDMQQCVPAAEQPFLEAAILHSLRDFAGPIAIGLRSGHVDAPNITLPLGAHVHLDLRDNGDSLLHVSGDRQAV